MSSHERKDLLVLFRIGLFCPVAWLLYVQTQRCSYTHVGAIRWGARPPLFQTMGI